MFKPAKEHSNVYQQTTDQGVAQSKRHLYYSDIKHCHILVRFVGKIKKFLFMPLSIQTFEEQKNNKI